MLFSLHPGLVDTNLLVVGGLTSGVGTGSGIHVDDGIKCTMWVATAHGLEGKSGSYFHNEVTEFLNPEELGRGDLMTPVAADPAEAAACWAQSLAMLGIPEAAFGHAC